MRPGRRRAATTAGFLATVACLACGPSEVPPLQRLLPEAQPVTLGDETRLGSGPPPRLLLRRAFAVGDALPAAVQLPEPLAEADRVVLHTRVWDPGSERLADRPRGTAALDVPGSARVVRVERAGAGARVRLSGLPGQLPPAPFTLQVTALPLSPSPLRVAATVRVEHGAVLEFGFGLREESWHPEAGAAPAVHFTARVAKGGGEAATLFERVLDPARPDDRRWHDARVELSGHTGREATIVLEARWSGGDGALALPAFAGPEVYVPAPSGEQPNVLLVSIDTLRARSLGAYGYERATSPFVDELARQGTLFETALTTSVTTAPSHMSLFTGLYPVHHGLVSGTEWKHRGVATLPALLRAAGFRTAAFTENGFLIRRKGFGEGFGRYVENRKLPERPRDVRLTFAQARRWLGAGVREPFFLFVHTYEVHAPYEPPEPYASLFRGDGTPAAGGMRTRRLRNRYDREVRYVDDELRALFDALREAGVAERTLAVLTADHGEEFAEHGRFQHGGAVYEETLRVPLVLWGPDRLPAGRRVSAPVSLVDVAPTLLGLLGLDAPASLDGIDLSALLRGHDAPPPRTLFAEARSPLRWVGPDAAVEWNPPLVALRADDAKFIVHRPAHGPAEPTLAFDLAADPLEREPRPLAPAEARRVERLADEYLASRRRSSGARAPPTGSEGLDPETEAQLRDLGYLR